MRAITVSTIVSVTDSLSAILVIGTANEEKEKQTVDHIGRNILVRKLLLVRSYLQRNQPLWQPARSKNTRAEATERATHRDGRESREEGPGQSKGW